MLKLATTMYSLTHYAKGTPLYIVLQTDCHPPDFKIFSLPFSGVFSPFPHGTCSLSDTGEYVFKRVVPLYIPQDEAHGTHMICW